MRLEKGASRVTKTDLQALLRYYGEQDDDRVRELVRQARAAREEGWWKDFGAGYDETVLDYVGYEYGASSIRVSNNLVIPGLLQTPEFAAAAAERLGASPETAGQAAAFARERRLQIEAQAPEQLYILDEDVLVRRAGDTLPAELGHIIEVAEDPAVTVRVIPRERGIHYGMQGPFTLLGFDVPLGEVLYIDKPPRSGRLVVAAAQEDAGEDPSPAAIAVAEKNEGLDRLQDIALSPDDSLDFIEKIRRNEQRRSLPGVQSSRVPGKSRRASTRGQPKPAARKTTGR